MTEEVISLLQDVTAKYNRHFCLTNSCSIFGPVFAGYIFTFSIIGRTYTVVITVLIGIACFFRYTAIKNNVQNLALNCALFLTINAYFSALYTYTAGVS